MLGFREANQQLKYSAAFFSLIEMIGKSQLTRLLAVAKLGIPRTPKLPRHMRTLAENQKPLAHFWPACGFQRCRLGCGEFPVRRVRSVLMDPSRTSWALEGVWTEIHQTACNKNKLKVCNVVVAKVDRARKVNALGMPSLQQDLLLSSSYAFPCDR